MLRKILENHVLANLTFVLVLVVGVLAYQQLPQEKLITDPLEEAVQKGSPTSRTTAAMDACNFVVRLNADAIKRAGLHPAVVARTLRMMMDGAIVARMQEDQGTPGPIGCRTSRSSCVWPFPCPTAVRSH